MAGASTTSRNPLLPLEKLGLRRKSLYKKGRARQNKPAMPWPAWEGTHKPQSANGAAHGAELLRAQGGKSWPRAMTSAQPLQGADLRKEVEHRASDGNPGELRAIGAGESCRDRGAGGDGSDEPSQSPSAARPKNTSNDRLTAESTSSSFQAAVFWPRRFPGHGGDFVNHPGDSLLSGRSLL